MVHYLVLGWLEIVLNEVFLFFSHSLWLCQINFLRLWPFLLFHHHSWILCFSSQLIRRKVFTWFVVDNAPWTPCTHVYLNVHFLLIWRIIQIEDFLSTFKCLLFCYTLCIRKIRWTICFFRCFNNLWSSLKIKLFGSINGGNLIRIFLCLHLKKFFTLLIS